ncbi:HAD-superfamily hydrolase, subfamily IA, variant 3 [Coriobacterium glomerans PW2]|uniref:HAD-superfamily hydrolase, subfamily IA, variant 3 n=1 Tax=Coriobacterium glomerans (strain ATCC 49209 / DSM 20642 / JCM 10262 / PW2) TaxID=700015 RepID=F2N6U1_CORGP|nr:HAD-IA family hydrolase [Coriobacterium glomerans]AEB06140.1 HAD-superfamily hydrolase, subfamily IA, variant 3 [Coriobacterium glomerans PW2]
MSETGAFSSCEGADLSAIPPDARSPLDAIIFDMDGVLVDTEYLDYRTQVAFVRRVNTELGRSADIDCTSLVGTSFDALYQELWHLTGEVLPLAELRHRFDRVDRASHESRDYPELFRVDVVPLIDFAHEHGIHLAVASSSERILIERVLEDCGILDDVDVIESGEDVRESKPHPEIYCKALARLDAQPDRTVAIEDSTPGIAAAKAAGLRVIGYRETRMRVDQTHADWLVDDMGGALDIIKRLI